MVQGRIMYGSVEDKMGVTRHTTTIVADDVIRLTNWKDHVRTYLRKYIYRIVSKSLGDLPPDYGKTSQIRTD